MSSEVLHRLQLELNAESYQRLKDIREAAGASSNTEVIRNALRLYEWFIARKNDGYSFKIANNEVTTDVEFLF